MLCGTPTFRVWPVPPSFVPCPGNRRKERTACQRKSWSRAPTTHPVSYGSWPGNTGSATAVAGCAPSPWSWRTGCRGPRCLRDAARPGAPPKLGNGQAGEVRSWLDGGPDPDAGGPSRRPVADVRKRIADSLRVGCALEGARRPVRRLGFRHMSPRPVHPRADPAARVGFRGASVRLAREAVPDGVAPEDVPVYLQDGARVGRKGMLSRVRARKGTRPRIVRDHRYGHLYLSPACPATGDAVGHVCGRASTAETDRHLRGIGERVPAGKRALVVPGGAGRHRSRDLGIPDSVSLPRLPPTARSSIRAERCSPS